MVDNAATGSTVSFIRAGQTPAVSVAVGEKCFVYYNGTDYVKVASTTVSGIVGPANGGTGVANNAASTLTISGAFATALTVTAATAVTLPTTGTLATLAGSETLTNKTIAYGSNTLTDVVGVTATQTLTNKTLVAPLLGTPSQGVLSSCTVDGTNAVGYRNIPQSGTAKTTGYTLATGDIGEFIEVGASGSIVVPDATFAAGDAVVIFNNTSSAITLTMSITTAYIGGTDADKATISLATRGICNVLFISGTVCVVTGNVS
jgi:hypothetical protein